MPLYPEDALFRHFDGFGQAGGGPGRDRKARRGLFDLSLGKLPADEGIDTRHLAEITEGFNCSDISYIVKTAARRTFNDSLREPEKPYPNITQQQLEDIIATRNPSVSPRALREYEHVRSELSPKDPQNRKAAIGFH